MSRRSFRFRLTLWHVGVLAAAQGLLIVTIAASLRAASLRTVDHELRQKALQALQSGPERERRGERAEGDFRPPRWIGVDQPETSPWDPAGVERQPPNTTRTASVWVGRQHARVMTVPWYEGSNWVGVLQVARPLAGHDEAWRSVVRTSLLLWPVTLLVAALGGVLLTNRALRPVRDVTRAAAEIGAEDLSRRLTVSGDDELAELSATFNAMIARLETAFEQQQRFTADASHELRTPLARIKVSTSLALSGPPDAAADRDALRVADQAADGMARLLDQLLFLARADADQLGLDMQPVALASLLREAAVDRAAVVVDPVPDDVVVTAEPDLLLRALANLLDNASRHSPEGAAVQLAVEHDEATIRIRVVDHGEGVSESALPHLAERFYRVDKARSRRDGGTGLGLAITASIVAAHRGRLAFEPTPKGGLTAIVTLPRHRDAHPTSADLTA